MVTPVSASKGASTASKSCCSVLVHSAQSEIEPPMWPKAGLAVEALVGTMLTARPNNPVNAATENSLCLPEAERTALTWDIALPLLADSGLIFILWLPWRVTS